MFLSMCHCPPPLYKKKGATYNDGKGTFQKRFDGFCPLSPLSFFEHNDCLLRGGGRGDVPPKSVKQKIR